MLIITLILYVEKVKKGLENSSLFELKIAQFYVFQGKKHTFYRSNEKILEDKAE